MGETERAKSTYLEENVFKGKLMLESRPSLRGLVNLTARNCEKTLAVDNLNIARAEVECGGIIYRPIDDDFIRKGGLYLPERLEEYGDDAALNREIEACINRHCDLSEFEVKVATQYIKLTYLTDKLLEVNYINIVAHFGNGKSRVLHTIGLLCLRPFLVVLPSIASNYRSLDVDHATLLDDDTRAYYRVINAGFQKLALIPRVAFGPDGEATIQAFSPFGPKILGGTKELSNEATKSRCIPINPKKTKRNDIKFRLSPWMKADFARLRPKLYLWQLRNWNRDLETRLDQSEEYLRQYKIDPRFVQIGIPLNALIENEALKRDFARVLEERSKQAGHDRQETNDGAIVRVIHELLFEVIETIDEGTGESKIDKVEWRLPPEWVRRECQFPVCEERTCNHPREGKPIKWANIAEITKEINKGRPENRKLTEEWVSREARKIGFKTERFKIPATELEKESIPAAIVFDPESLETIFSSYTLPVPGNLTRPPVPRPPNPKQGNDLQEGRVNQNVPGQCHSATAIRGL